MLAPQKRIAIRVLGLVELSEQVYNRNFWGVCAMFSHPFVDVSARAVTVYARPARVLSDDLRGRGLQRKAHQAQGEAEEGRNTREVWAPIACRSLLVHARCHERCGQHVISDVDGVFALSMLSYAFV